MTLQGINKKFLANHGFPFLGFPCSVPMGRERVIASESNIWLQETTHLGSPSGGLANSIIGSS